MFGYQLCRSLVYYFSLLYHGACYVWCTLPPVHWSAVHCLLLSSQLARLLLAVVEFDSTAVIFSLLTLLGVLGR